MFKIDQSPGGWFDEALKKAEQNEASANVPTGWKCPLCIRINAPHVAVCPCSVNTFKVP